MTRRNQQVGESSDDFVTDAEIARRWRIGWKTARVAITALDRDPTFPKKDPLFGRRRFWPAVQTFMRRRYKVTMDSPPTSPSPEEMENFDEPTAKARRAGHSRNSVAPAR